MSCEDVPTEMSLTGDAYEPEVSQVARNFLEELEKEQNRLNEKFPICNLLIDEAYDRIYSMGLVPGHDSYADVIKLKPMKLSQKVLVSVLEYPELNLTNKVQRLKGEILKTLEGETQCQILIKGRNSMTDQIKEEELRLSKDPQHVHLKKELFLEIITEATPIECYTRIAYALAEIRKYLLPETNDNHEILPDAVNNARDQIKIEQFEEPPLDIDLKETHLEATPHLVAKTEASDSNNPLSISLADKLIKLLDETVLNPNFQYSENETKMVANHIDVLSSFMVSKTSAKHVSHENANITSIENNLKNINPTTSSACSSSTINKMDKKKGKSEKLGISSKRIVKRKITKDSIKTKSIKIKMNKLKAIKKRNLEKALDIKKQKYPGIFYTKDSETDKIVKRKISNKSSLSHFLKRPNAVITNDAGQQDIDDDDDDEYKPFTIEYLQENPTELVFEFTPREIIITLLDSMKDYPVLWEFHDEPYNENYSNAIEYLCEIMNDKWLLNIEPIQMHRSISRVLRFYRFLFPFDSIDSFTEYFDKCAYFLPAAVVEIPNARCSHCYRCFKRDKDLIAHLLAEHNSLKWPYKCPHCRESFRTTNEYELHKQLPHYLEIFTCQECNKKFNYYYAYSKHFPHQKPELPRNYVCDICQKEFTSKRVLAMHKDHHQEKRYKCHLCPKAYFSRTSLMMHLRKHRKELNYICDVCGQGFVQQKYLNDHMDVHTGFKVTCNICNLQVRRGNLYRHLRTVHVACEGTLETTFRAKGYNYKKLLDLENRAVSAFKHDYQRKRKCDNGPRQYECKICKIQFDRLKVLKDHNKELHSDVVQKLPCKMCDSILSQLGNLKRHYRNKHKLTELQVYAIVVRNMDVETALTITSPEVLNEITGETASENKNNKYPGIFYMKDTETDKIVIRKISNKSSLDHCLKRSNAETSKPEKQDIDVDEYKPFTIEHLQQNPSELVFEFAPRELIITLLESMESYPVLWEFHDVPFNEDYSKAIEYLCEIMNDKWLLNIEPLQMSRSITRILRFYRFLFPFDNIEKYMEYFDKCALFLPSTVIEIPHARCSHCYRCFKRDKELKSHLLAEHDSLKWPHKCPHCRESFRTIEEYEFHKRLPHYLEAFTCPKCNKKYNEHKAYKRHAHYEKSDVPRNHVCDVCQKAFRLREHLTTHKRYHEEKKYKCHLCPCTYYSCSNLTTHLKKHRKELNYICDVCGKAYVQLKHLQEHMDMHTGFKVTCNICNLKVRKYNLNRHLRTVHVPCEGTIESTFRARSYNYKRGQATRVFNPDNIKRKRRPADKPRQYECKVCNIHFDRLKVLKDHNKELHSDLVQKLPCKMCDSILSQIGNLKRHYRNKHKLPEYKIFAFVEKDMDVNTVLAMTSDEAMLELTK